MKRILAFLLAALMLSGCGSNTVAEVTETTAAVPQEVPLGLIPAENPYPFESRFEDTTLIQLSDEGITVEGNEAAVYTSNDIIYYEDKDAYESGNPYGEGEDQDKHTAEEAAAHTVVNITQPGSYTLRGTLSAGQIRVDLGEDAYEDPTAVVELKLMGVDITCTVAPAILFLNTYECDGDWSAEEATSDVDTSAAGANLVLMSTGNKISGSHVAKIFKDKDGEKKLWKQDGAIYSYMSMNIWGLGSLDLTADNEGLGTELHLTINGGDINIYSDNDGINTNEDGVSVTTINAGRLHIVAGLGKEGDGIDSNGYLVINGGTVVSSANPASDAGLDSDLGSYINGGTVIALGSTMDWAESKSGQVTMNLQFAQYQSGTSAIVVTDEVETPVFAYDPGEDEILGNHARQYMGAIVSAPVFTQGATYHIYTDGTITGEETGGVYSMISAFEGSVQMQYTGTDMRMGGRGRHPGGEMPVLPDGETLPADFDPGQFGGRDWGGGKEPPEGFEGEMPAMPEGETMSDNIRPNRGEPTIQTGEPSTEFYMNDMVNAFSGIDAAAK